MKIRLVDNGYKRIAVIKEVRIAYGFNLKDSKQLTDRAPVQLPDLPAERGIEFVRRLREAGATVEAFNESTVLDKITAASYIQVAATAIGEGNLKEVRLSLRAALRLIGDFDDDELCLIND